MRRHLVLAVSVLAVAALASRDGPAPEPTNPAWTEVRQALEDTYDLAAWSAKVPVDLAAPVLVEVALGTWVRTLPLRPEVQERLQARIAAPSFVDELVPFGWFVKRMYDTGRARDPDFATFLRARPPGEPSVPGREHALFQFVPPPSSEGGATPGVSPAVAARLLELYDAIYLDGIAAEAPMDARLQCAGMDEAALAARGEAAAPAVRGLLDAVDRDLAPDRDLRSALDRVRTDDAVLETVTLTLVDFLNAEVCKHYRSFAVRVQREAQWRAWALAELERPGGGRLFAQARWLASRRHAVHVVVDGLQGHLVEALADGRPGQPLLVAAARDDRSAAALGPAQRSTVPAPSMSTGFLHHIAERGYADPSWIPFFRSLYAGNLAGVARQGISTTPTISVRNLPIAWTGAPVAGEGATGIPNFHFVDREWVVDGVAQGRPYYFYGNDALQLPRLARAAGMRTMFERFERLSTMSCGAQYDEAAHWSFDALLALAVGEKIRDFGERLCLATLRERAAHEVELRAALDALLAREGVLGREHRSWELWDRWVQRAEREEARRLVARVASLLPEAMPDYLLVYNPWPDHFAHRLGPFSDAIIGPTGEIARLDHWLGALDRVYREAGVWDRTLFGMAGDHGLTPVWWLVQPEDDLIGGLERAGIRLAWTKISSDEGEGPKLNHPLRPPSMRGLDLVVASTAGGNYMLDLFVDQGDGWGRQPVLAELRALRTLGGRTVDVVGETARRLAPSLDYLVVREGPCDVDRAAVVVVAPRGGALVEARIRREGDRIWYGRPDPDPLDLGRENPYAPLSPEEQARLQSRLDRCLAAEEGRVETWCTEAEWRAAGWGSVRPDAVPQLAHLYDTDRAGTIDLFPRAGVGYNSTVPGRHAGESFHEKDAFVGVWGAPLPPGPRPEVAVNGQVPVTLAAWLTGEAPEAGTEGWGWGPIRSE